jgi:hypothetical protein
VSFHSPILRHPGAAGIGLLSVLLLAACGASSTTAPSTSSPSTAAGTSTPSSSAATPTSAAAVSTTCPTSAEIATLTGTTFPAPQQASSTGYLLCSYNDTTSGANLVIGVTAAPGTTASTLQIAVAAAASADNVTPSSVSGFGSAAYAFTADDASSNPSGVATSVIEILDGSDLIDITAALTLAEVEAVATHVLAQ